MWHDDSENALVTLTVGIGSQKPAVLLGRIALVSQRTSCIAEACCRCDL